jgi:acetyl/propionyl-CoA carboxylase alpha subunit
MIAKLITYGKDRNEAIDLMKKALGEYKVVGLPNNLKFLKRVIEDPKFIKGEYDTSYIPENIDKLLKKEVPKDPFDLVSAVIARYHNHSTQTRLPS